MAAPRKVSSEPKTGDYNYAPRTSFTRGQMRAVLRTIYNEQDDTRCTFAGKSIFRRLIIIPGNKRNARSPFVDVPKPLIVAKNKQSSCRRPSGVFINRVPVVKSVLLSSLYPKRATNGLRIPTVNNATGKTARFYYGYDKRKKKRGNDGVREKRVGVVW